MPIPLPMDFVGIASGIQNQRDPTACEAVGLNWTDCDAGFASDDVYAYANGTAGGGGGIAFESHTTATGTSNNLQLSKPSGTVADDLLVAFLSFEKGSSVSITPPGGWTLILRTDRGTDTGIASYYKVAGSGEPNAYTWTMTQAPKWAAGMARYSGVDNQNPIDASGGQTGSGTSQTAPSITTTVDDTVVLAYYGSKADSTYTPASGTTERWDVPNTADGLPSNMMADFVQTIEGATEEKTATASISEIWEAQQVALVPASGGSSGGNDSAWRDFGFNLNATDVVERVEVGVEWFRASTNPILNVTVSWDGGTSWATNQTATNKSTDDDTLEWLNFTSATSWTASKLSDANFRVRLGTNASGGRLDYVSVRVNFDRTPSVTAFRLKDGVGASKAGEQLDVNTTYYFLFNVTDEDGWSDIGEAGSVSLRLWYDGNASPELTFTEQTTGANYRIELRYVDTGDPATASLSEWSVVEGSATYNASASSLTAITSGATTIGYEFKLAFELGFQAKHAVDPTDAATGGYNDADSWNAEVVATDGTSTTTLQAASTGEHMEFGVFQYTFVNVSGDWTVSLAPGEPQSTNSVVVHHRSNDAFTLKVWFVTDLTKGSDTVSITNVEILAAADADDNITADTAFAGTGEANATFILGTSTWYFPHTADGNEDTTTVQFRVTVPLGTASGTYTATLTLKIEQQPP